MTTDMVTTGSRAHVTTRQQFTGRDDVQLLVRMESIVPWSHAGGVMDAWKQIAGALNSDPECAMTGLTATSCRGRFHRMVTQRKDGQEKMLRRGTADQGEYELKIAKLDAMIASMDGDLAKAAQLDALYDHLMKDAKPKPAWAPRIETASANALTLQHSEQDSHPLQSAVAAPSKAKPHGQRAPTKQVPATAVNPDAPFKAAIPSPRVVSESARFYPLKPPADVIPVDLPKPRANAKRPADESLSIVSSKRVAVARGDAFSSESSDIGRLLSVAERAVALLVRKIEQDQEIATAERQWRREQARAHREMMEAMEQQTNQLKTIALECQWKGL